MNSFLELLPLLLWTGLWIAGGWALAAALFRLRANEAAMVGIGTGLVLETWLANLLAHALPVPIAFWLAAALIFIAGVLAAIRYRSESHFKPSWRAWLILGGLTLLFTLIGRGLGIFDDYQNLPTISLMAASDIPPHFALNPSLNFGYHYLLLLFAAQIMLLGNIFPWTALDIARGLVLALPLVLAGLWARRMARSNAAAVVTAFMLAFAGGARWLLLFLPGPLLQYISDHITLIGSASTSARNLAEALLTNWKIDGAGPIPFPFAFYTGINQPYIMAYTGIAGSGILILLLLLLMAGRGRNWVAGIVFGVLLAGLAMANEIAFLLLALGFAVVGLTWLISRRSWKLPRAILIWAAILVGATALASLQGGMLTEIIRTRFASGAAQASYFDTSPALVWPPAIVSAHLGSLSVFDPAQLLAALAEIGPIILVSPLLFIWGWKSFRLGRWYETALIAASFGALIALFVAFKGPLFTATPRLMSGWFFACILYSVPLVWLWARRRSSTTQGVLIAAGLISTLAGLVLFGIQLLAIQRPVLATFISPLDARVARLYWNKLDSGVLVFDPVVFRAPTVFGRFTDSSPSWYSRDPKWEALANAPDPTALHQAGFGYMYFDKDYWDKLTPAQQLALHGSCVKQLIDVEGIHSEQDYSKDFRRLLDIRGCR